MPTNCIEGKLLDKIADANRRGAPARIVEGRQYGWRPKRGYCVSIIVPTLNEKEHVLHLVESVCLQTYRPIELIFVDGGSTDGTRRLISSFVSALSGPSLKLILLYEENFDGCKSPAHARNIGIKASSSDYLILLDADTKFMHNESVSKLKNLLDLHDFVRVKAKIQIDTTLEQHISSNYSHYYHCAYRKWIFDKLPFDEKLKYGEDRDLWYRIKKNLGVNVYTTQEILLIRHLPHTKTEYFNQTRWYAKSYAKFAESVLEKGNFIYLDEIAETLLGCFLSALPPLFFVVSLLKDIKTRNKIDAKFLLINFLRRYLFSFYLATSSFDQRSLKIYVTCMSLWLPTQVNKLYKRLH